MVREGASCPVCGSVDYQTVYTVSSVPVHSVRLVKTAEESLSTPVGDIDLKGCRHCGMVWNAAFDPGKMRYDACYEETQGYSETFNQFHWRFAQSLIDGLELTGKTVLEIGCGKGEFLVLLAEMGIESGIGFDPGYDHRRQAADSRLQFYQQFFPPDAAESLPAIDTYICKMTLEHIARPGELIDRLREYVGGQHTSVVIMVPALERIVEESAWWDIYYEHCNYFCEHSLYTLFARRGFTVREMFTEYDGQYLCLIADTLPAPPQFKPAKPVLAEDLAETIGQVIGQWGERLAPAAARGSLLVWGAASKAVALINAVPELRQGTRLVDINPHKHQTYLPSTELQIENPEDLAGLEFDTILVANPVYLSEVSAALDRLNIRGPVIALENVPSL